MRIILIFTLSIGLLFGTMSRFDESITDYKTGLIWQDNTPSSTLQWQDAILYCEALTLGDYSDWRLPNKKELQSIIDFGRADPSINTAFLNVNSHAYWSSTTRAGYDEFAWAVNFSGGYIHYETKDTSSYVRCVRTGL